MKRASAATGESLRVTLHLGQAVPWRPSPLGFAQVDCLMRRRVRLVYRAANGRMRFACVGVKKLGRDPLLFDLRNPFDRGIIKRSKTFIIP